MRGAGRVETFLYLAGLCEDRRAEVLRASRGGLRHLFEAALGAGVAITETADRDGALLVARQPDAAAPAIETARSDGFVVVTFGRAGAGAGAIVAALSLRPLDAVVADVTAREGCFGCMIHDRRAGVVKVFGDRLGQRTLRWAEIEGGFAVAPHDVALAATGEVSSEPDPVSLASVRAAGWSIGDVSLLSGVSVTRAGELATLAPARLGGRARASFVVGEMPRRAGDSDADPVEVAMRYLQDRIGRSDAIEVEVDGGLDSRAALAAAVTLRGASGITGRARGNAVDVARQVCRRAGVRFTPYPETVPDPDRLVAAWSRAAAACNGTVDARTFEPGATEGDVVTLCGDGGFAVAAEDGRRLDPRLPERIAAGAGIPDAVREPLARRVRAVVRRLAEEVHGPGLAMRFDRSQRWGVAAQAFARDPAMARRVSPFQSRALLGAVDAGSGGGDLRRALIEGALPGLSDLPVWTGGAMAAPSAGLRALAEEIVASDHSFLCNRERMPVDPGPLAWRDLGARRFLRICREILDAARIARLRACADPGEPVLLLR